MANPPLVKSNWIVNEEGLRVIDNNRRAEEKINSYYEEQSRRPIEEELNYDSFSDEFQGGLNAEQLDALTMDQSTILSSAENGETVMQANGLSDASPSSDREEKFDSDTIADASMRTSMGATASGTQVGAQQAAEPARGQVGNDAKRIIEDAQVQADAIVREAHEEAERIKTQAHDEGYETGYEKGLAEGQELGEQKVSREQDEEYERKSKQLAAEYQRTLDELEPKMVDTLTRVYEHVFDVNLANDKKIILHLLKTAMSRSGESGSFIIHVSPDDYDDIVEEKDHLRAAIPNPNTTMEVIEDPLLKSTECMIEADGGIFDCSLGVELSELSRKLRLLAFDRRRN